MIDGEDDSENGDQSMHGCSLWVWHVAFLQQRVYVQTT